MTAMIRVTSGNKRQQLVVYPDIDVCAVVGVVNVFAVGAVVGIGVDIVIVVVVVVDVGDDSDDQLQCC